MPQEHVPESATRISPVTGTALSLLTHSLNQAMVITRFANCTAKPFLAFQDFLASDISSLKHIIVLNAISVFQAVQPRPASHDPRQQVTWGALMRLNRRKCDMGKSDSPRKGEPCRDAQA